MTAMTRLLGLLLGLPARDGRAAEVQREVPVAAGGNGVALLTDHSAPPVQRAEPPVVLMRDHCEEERP